METIGQRVRRLRSDRKISRRALAKASGMSYSSLADLENGYQKSTTKLHRLAESLFVSAWELEHGVDKEGLKLKSAPQFTTREMALLEAFRRASPDGRRAIEGAAAGVTTPAEDAPKERALKKHRAA